MKCQSDDTRMKTGTTRLGKLQVILAEKDAAQSDDYISGISVNNPDRHSSGQTLPGGEKPHRQLYLTAT